MQTAYEPHTSPAVVDALAAEWRSTTASRASATMLPSKRGKRGAEEERVTALPWLTTPNVRASAPTKRNVATRSTRARMAQDRIKMELAGRVVELLDTVSPRLMQSDAGSLMKRPSMRELGCRITCKAAGHTYPTLQHI